MVEAATPAELHRDVMARDPPGRGRSRLVRRPRLALARALLGRPRILLLDEASSSLDAVAEQRINQNLKSLDCTRLMIAHRLSTVRDADMIVVMDEVRVVECGAHEELTARNGAYTALIAAQVPTDELHA